MYGDVQCHVNNVLQTFRVTLAQLPAIAGHWACCSKTWAYIYALVNTGTSQKWDTAEVQWLESSGTGELAIEFEAVAWFG